MGKFYLINSCGFRIFGVQLAPESVDIVSDENEAENDKNGEEGKNKHVFGSGLSYPVIAGDAMARASGSIKNEPSLEVLPHEDSV